MQGTHDLFERTSGKIGAADAALKQRVARDQHLLGGKIETDTSLGVAGGVQNIR